MNKPNFWLMLISEFVIGGLAIFIFWKFFLQPMQKGAFNPPKEEKPDNQSSPKEPSAD